MKPTYHVPFTPAAPDGSCAWDDPLWSRSDPLAVAAFRPESTAHRPVTECRMLYDDTALYGLFRVQDRYVRSRHTAFQDPVCRDSCVECFLRPDPARGYFNFEMNAGGALFTSYVTDPTRTSKGFAARELLPAALGRRIKIHSTLPEQVYPEIEEPLLWLLEFHIPLEVFRAYVPLPDCLADRPWRANFYKCGDDTSHPHWAAWAPVPSLNFHLPDHFGSVEFTGRT